MSIEIGFVEAIFRYPVKSMAGESVDHAEVGWYGIEGDRRLAFRRMGNCSGMPWLTAGHVAELVLYSPRGRENQLPTHVRTPEGRELAVFGEELAAVVAQRHGSAVEMTHLRHGIFDESSLSVIALDTVREIERLAGVSPDVRRFRPNVVVRAVRPLPFQEDEWVGGELSFGEGPVMSVTMRDERCAMLNLNPETAKSDPEILKAVVGRNDNHAGVYGSVIRTGRVEVGQRILLSR